MQLRTSLSSIAVLFVCIGWVRVANAQRFGDNCYTQFEKPYVCAAVEVSGGQVGVDGSFQTSVPAPTLDHFNSHTHGVAEMFGSGFVGAGHARAEASFKHIGALVDTELLIQQRRSEGAALSTVTARALVRMKDDVTVQALGLTDGAPVKCTAIVSVEGSFQKTGGGGDLTITVSTLDGTLRWEPPFGIVFNHQYPKHKLSHELDLYVGQVFAIELMLGLGARLDNDTQFARTAGADLTDGASIAFACADPRVRLSSLSGHDYRISESTETNDGGVENAQDAAVTSPIDDAGSANGDAGPANNDAGPANADAGPANNDAGASTAVSGASKSKSGCALSAPPPHHGSMLVLVSGCLAACGAVLRRRHARNA